MGNTAQERRRSRIRRHHRIRKKVRGTTERPRMAIFRSLRHIYAQVIDDVAERTVASVSTLDKQARDQLATVDSRIERSKVVGKLLAERLKERGVTRVCFDRGGYLYHGHVKAVADGAREGGLEL
jgi:large subunit ribosomal protein L18